MNTRILMSGIASLALAMPLMAQEAPAAPAEVEAGLSLPAEKSGGSASASVSRWAAEQDDDASFYDRFIADRLSVGAVYTHTFMHKNHVPYDKSQKHNFLGNINRLSEDGNDGIGVVVRYEFCDYVAFQFSTGTKIGLGMWNNDHASCDAEFDADAMTYEVLLMYPIKDLCLVPYLGLGVTDFSCSIDYNDWWRYGWKDTSMQETTGTIRWMLLDEPSMAFSLTAGATLDLYRHLHLDVFYRVAFADDCKIDFRNQVPGHSRHHVRSGYVPLDCSSLGIALRAVF